MHAHLSSRAGRSHLEVGNAAEMIPALYSVFAPRPRRDVPRESGLVLAGRRTQGSIV